MSRLNSFFQLLKPNFIALSFGIALLTVMPTLAAPEAGEGGDRSVSVRKLAQAAAAAMKKEEWEIAQSAYKKAISFDPRHEDFYFGLYHTSVKMQQWNEAVLALEELFVRNPEYKDQMLLEYGECLSHLNRHDEAKRILEEALGKVNKPSIVEARLKKLTEQSITVQKAMDYQEPICGWRPCSNPPELTILNAFLKSECVTICKYEGYEHKGPITFYNTPKAKYRIEEHLKGPQLDRDLAIKYEFLGKLIGEEKPVGWTFSRDMMPKKGSKWIIFITNGIPIQGMYHTFHGSYGRQELNDQNIDEINRIMEKRRTSP